MIAVRTPGFYVAEWRQKKMVPANDTDECRAELAVRPNGEVDPGETGELVECRWLVTNPNHCEIRALRNGKGSYRGVILPLARSQEEVNALVQAGCREFYMDNQYDLPVYDASHQRRLDWEAWMADPNSAPALDHAMRQVYNSPKFARETRTFSIPKSEHGTFGGHDIEVPLTLIEEVKEILRDPSQKMKAILRLRQTMGLDLYTAREVLNQIPW